MTQTPPELRAPLIGRDAELGVLRRAAESALSKREVRAVTLVGGPGIGKARIVEEFLSGFLGESPDAFRVFQARVRAPALSHGLIERILRARFGVQDGEDRETSVERVRTEVSTVLDDRRVGDVCFLLGSLMGVTFPETPLTRVLAEDAVQARLLRRSVVRSFFEADAARRPLCLVLEDLHVSDGDSLELIGTCWSTDAARCCWFASPGRSCSAVTKAFATSAACATTCSSSGRCRPKAPRAF